MISAEMEWPVLQQYRLPAAEPGEECLPGFVPEWKEFNSRKQSDFTIVILNIA
jgi:hypothetical protein